MKYSISHQSAGRVVGLTALLLSVATTTAQTTRSADDIRTFTLTARPAAHGTRLMVDSLDKIHANAAPRYLQVLLALPTSETIESASDPDMEIDDDAEFLRVIKEKASWLDTRIKPQMQAAVIADHCDWELPLREQGFSVILPHLNDCRALANLMIAQSRLASASGDIPQALRILQTLITFADHIDDGENAIISNLVAIGIFRRCQDRIDKVIQHPDAPNLYWALRDLPTPFGNVRGVIAMERDSIPYTFPELRQASLTQEQVDRVLKEMDSLLRESPTRPTFTPGTVSPEKFRQYVSTHRQLMDTMHDVCRLPYPDALSLAERFPDELRAAIADQPQNPLLKMVPAINHFLRTNARVDRTTAALATVEALRAYAASHNNTLPERLTDLTDTPAPLNPTTGSPFGYARTSSTSATLTAPPLSSNLSALYYTINLLP